MSLDLLGEDFDLHGGGLRPRSSRTTRTSGPRPSRSGARFARHWVHNGMVDGGGEKMSKSLGNFTDPRDLVADRPTRAPTGCSCSEPTTARRSRSPPRRLADAAAALGLDALARRFAGSCWRRSPLRSRTSATRFERHMDDDLIAPGHRAAVRLAP